MEKKKTIIFVQNVEYPQQGAIDIFYYSKYLSIYEDYKIKVIVSKINENISHKNLEIIEVGKINYFLFIMKSFFLIRDIKKKQGVEYVYFFALHPFSVILQYFTKYLLHIKTIYDITSGPIGNGLIAKISYYTVKIGIYLSNFFILDHIKLYDKLKLNTKKKFDVIGIGYDHNNFRDNDVNKVFTKEGNEIIFTYIGTLNSERNLNIFINAFIENLELNKNIKLYFIGKGSGEKILKELSGKYLNKNIFFLGTKQHKVIPDYIKSSDILVSYVPKVDYFEYQPPTKLIEYLSCNKPLMATDTYAQKEILEGYEFLIHKDDQKSTSIKIKYFIENIDEIKKNNFSDIVKKYSWDKLVKKIDNLIKK